MSERAFDLVQPTTGVSVPEDTDAPGLDLLLQATGDAEASVQELSDLTRSARYYRVTEQLATAINTALCVRAPLLLTGEPGTGKTQVAHYLQWFFGMELHRYQARSTSTAVDLKYEFDAVGYLHFAQANEDADVDHDKIRDERFLHRRALWLAYEETKPCVLLIDEIDKAPRDFPNDLLHEIDEHEFSHPFDPRTKITPKASRPPLVIATSNAERRLPDAFLRRCIVHHIELTRDLVAEIVTARSGRFPGLEQPVVDIAVKRFFELRNRADLSRHPSVGELLTWLAVLAARGVPSDRLAGPLGALPGLEALIKDAEDVRKLPKQ